ncbi:MAG: glycosyltransferase involved in cell wall biosynthesis, partial [Flavobacteriaceae bacterium]
MNKISIIIPILNEANNIVSLLQYLIDNSSKKNVSEIIVVDGGSVDQSLQIASTFSEKHENIVVISSEKGRAKQMNFGSLKATGTIFYFLHADSFPPN